MLLSHPSRFMFAFMTAPFGGLIFAISLPPMSVQATACYLQFYARPTAANTMKAYPSARIAAGFLRGCSSSVGINRVELWSSS